MEQEKNKQQKIQKKTHLTKTSSTVRRSARLNKSIKESSRQSIDFANLEEDEEMNIPSPIAPSPALSLVSSSIANTARRTLEIDPLKQEIYDCIESLEKKATENATTSSNQGIQSHSPQEPPIVNTLKQEIFELETLNKHLKQEHETIKVRNEIQRTQNENILLHLALWYDKNKKLKEKNKTLKRKVLSLKYKILIKKPMIAIAKKKVKKTKLEFLAQAFEGV